MKSYPQVGDIIRIDFDPQSGKEIKKARPALVVCTDPKKLDQKSNDLEVTSLRSVRFFVY